MQGAEVCGGGRVAGMEIGVHSLYCAPVGSLDLLERGVLWNFERGPPAQSCIDRRRPERPELTRSHPVPFIPSAVTITLWSRQP
jgi:hypothetical protein